MAITSSAMMPGCSRSCGPKSRRVAAGGETWHQHHSRSLCILPWMTLRRANRPGPCVPSHREQIVLKRRHSQTPKEAIMDHSQEYRRQQAMARYLAGDKIEVICRDLYCAKSWLYKWKARYQADNPTWATSRSTQPQRKPSQTPQPVVERI